MASPPSRREYKVGPGTQVSQFCLYRAVFAVGARLHFTSASLLRPPRPLPRLLAPAYRLPAYPAGPPLPRSRVSRPSAAARCGWARGLWHWGCCCCCCSPRRPAPARLRSCTSRQANTAPNTTVRRCWAARWAGLGRGFVRTKGRRRGLRGADSGIGWTLGIRTCGVPGPAGRWTAPPTPQGHGGEQA